MAYPLWGDYATPTNFLRCCRSFYLVAWLILKHLLGLAGWRALFKKEFFSHWTVVCSQLSWRTDCYPRRIQFELLCRLRSSQSVGQFYAKSGKWKLVFSHKNFAFKNLLAHLQQLRCATPWDGFWTMPHPGKILSTWSSTPCQSTDFCASFAQAYCNRQI